MTKLAAMPDAELAKWIEDYVMDSSSIFPEFASVLREAARRLAALPKGQEDDMDHGR